MSENPNVGKVFNLTGGGSNGSLKLESLDVTKPPIKTTYKSGESFDPTEIGRASCRERVCQYV